MLKTVLALLLVSAASISFVEAGLLHKNKALNIEVYSNYDESLMKYSAIQINTTQSF